MPGVGAKRRRPTEPSPVEIRRRLESFRRHVEQNCEHVGDRFAEEARKIHFGEIEKRDIYGAATDDEARELRAERVPFGRIPWIEYQEHWRPEARGSGACAREARLGCVLIGVADVRC